MIRTPRLKPLLIAVVLLLALQLIRLATLDAVAPELTRRRAFLLDPLPAGTRLSQVFTVRDDRLSRLRIAGAVTAGATGAVVARVIDVGDQGEMPRVSLELAIGSAPDCCNLTFAPIERSGGRRYRLELDVQRITDGEFSLQVAATSRRGGLVINGHEQSANLVLDAGDTALAPLRSAPRVPLALLVACFAGVDAAVLGMLYLLWRPISSSPRRR